jgi:hypothetical protein
MSSKAAQKQVNRWCREQRRKAREQAKATSPEQKMREMLKRLFKEPVIQ